jgi:hypothetical protein
MHVVRYAASNSIRVTAKHFDLDRRQVRSWVRNDESFRHQTQLHTRYRLARTDMSASDYGKRIVRTDYG